jgi:hypothetical protein
MTTLTRFPNTMYRLCLLPEGQAGPHGVIPGTSQFFIRAGNRPISIAFIDRLIFLFFL